MSPEGPTPPEPPFCLCRPYRSSGHKGGTIIFGNVVDRETHRGLLADPAGYRPQKCPTCGWLVLHRHDFVERQLRGEVPPAEAVKGTVAVTLTVTIARYRCANEECRATWRILPLFVARHLWHSWRVVEAHTLEAGSARSTVPARTVGRWTARLEASAGLPRAALATSGQRLLERVAQTVGSVATRLELVLEYARQATLAVGARLAAVAGLVHCLDPGLRLM